MATPAMLVEIGMIAAKIETTPGTANAPAAVDAGILVWDIGLEERIDMGERNPVKTTFSRPTAVPQRRMYELTFRSEIVGGTTAGSRPPVWNLLRACAMTEAISAGVSVTYTPLTAPSSQETLTIDVYRDGKRYRLTGAMGNCRVTVTDTGVPVFEFTFNGVYNAPVDASLLTSVPYTSAAPPAAVGGTLTLMTQTLRGVGFEFDLGNTVEMVEDMTQASGYLRALVVDRSPTITVAPEDELVATVEWLTKKTSGTVGEFIGLIGSAAGNIFRLRAPAAQVMGAGWAERTGKIIRSLNLACRRLASDDNDECTLRWT